MSEVLVPLNVKLPEDIIAGVGLVSAWVHDPELGSLNRNVFPLDSSDALLEVMKKSNNQLLGAVLFLAAAGEWTEEHANAAATDLQEVEATNKLKEQIGAVVLLAEFVAAEDVEFNDALYPQTHYSLERSTRLDAVVEALEERRQQHEQAVSEKHMENMEKEMQTWIAERLKDPDVTGFERLYLLIGANKYDEALLYVDSIVGLNDGQKARAKREIVVNRYSTDPRLDMAEIDSIDGLDDGQKAWAKREIFNKIMTGLSRKETVREKLNNLKARTSV